MPGASSDPFRCYLNVAVWEAKEAESAHMKTTVASLLFMLGCLAIIPDAHAQEELANGNTAGGHAALDSLTSGQDNTALGAGSLRQNTNGNDNTAVGSQSLRNNRGGDENTGVGSLALTSNTLGNANTATGDGALRENTTGNENTADGTDAMSQNTTGSGNTAVGRSALFGNKSGTRNVAIGAQAMSAAEDADFNTAVGVKALNRSRNLFNIGLGYSAGSQLTADHNICIGNDGQTTDSGTIRIGSSDHVRAFIAGISGARISGGVVQVNDAGQLGVAPSSRRFKHEIRPMNTASEAIFELSPVTFRYDQDIDPQTMPQFGLIAEEVAKVNPALVLSDKEGKPYTVRYEAVNAMLLNEFLKEHRKNEKQEATITELKVQIATLAAMVKEQAAQIQRVTLQLSTANGAAGMRSDIDGSSQEADVSGSEQVSSSLADLR